MKYILSILFILVSNNSFACSCSEWPSDRNKAIKEAYNQASDIVLAKAVSISKPGKYEALEYKRSGFRKETTHFTRLTSWKGDAPDKFTTSMLIGGGMCGVSFRQGVTYLLYLRKSLHGKNAYATSICSLTNSMVGAEEDMKHLERVWLYPNHNNGIYWSELADVYLSGKGVKKDAHKAIQLYQKAEQNLNINARLTLATLYMEGKHTKQNYVAAFNRFKYISEYNHDHYATFMLGKLYRDGLGTKVELDKAIDSFNQSCLRGFKRACIEHDKLTGKP